MTIFPNHNRRGAGLQVDGAQEKFFRLCRIGIVVLKLVLFFQKITIINTVIPA